MESWPTFSYNKVTYRVKFGVIFLENLVEDTSRALPGFPGHLQHWLKIRGGNTIQKYCYNPNFIPIGQLEAEIQHSGPHFWP